MSRYLDHSKIIDTAFALSQRVKDRFPESGLAKVSADVTHVAKRASALAQDLEKPHWVLRIVATLLMLGLLTLVAFAISRLTVPISVANISDLTQGLDAMINDLFFAGLGVWFAFTIEGRLKRKKAMDLFAELRSMSHVVDMHQLTKDPDRAMLGYKKTEASPVVTLTPWELVRYLDYCSEMQAILGKLAALCVQKFDDSITLQGVDELEALTGGFSHKCWQKILIVQAGLHNTPHDNKP